MSVDTVFKRKKTKTKPKIKLKKKRVVGGKGRQKMRYAKAKGKPSVGRQRMANETTFVYILASCSSPGRSYVGVTNNFERRLSQHQGETTGGAKYTSMYKPWRLHVMFQLNNRHDALSIEWKIKHRKHKADGAGIEGRVNAAIRIGGGVAGFKRCV